MTQIQESALSANAQHIAMEACRLSKPYLKPGISEKAFAVMCEQIMRDLGAEELWYPMLVNFGTNSIYCTRGDHLPSDTVYLKENDIVLVDYSPLVRGYWGDYSETILVGNDEFYSSFINDAKDIYEKTLHVARTAVTIGELFNYCSALIQSKGYELLDPNGNIGHTIENQHNQKNRVYIYPENKDVPLEGKRWAIEPHIGKNGYGAKFENVIQR